MCDKSVLNLITEKVCAAAREVLGGKLKRVVLYGSYARGDYDEYSDVDIFVLADIPQEECCRAGLDILDLVGDISLEHNILICPHVTGSMIFHEYSETLPYYMNVIKEGIELYAA